MLKDKLREAIVDYIENTGVRSELGIGDEFRLEFLAQGEYNINYTIENQGRKWVFRVNTDSQLGLENQIEYEYSAIKLLEKSGVTPKGIYVDGSKSRLNYGVLIMEYLHGRPLEYSTDLGMAGRIFGKIHSLDTNIAKEKLITESSLLRDRVTEGERWLRRYMESPKGDLRVKRLFDKLLETTRKNIHQEEYFERDPWMVINNTEVNSHNFIIGDGGSYLIDWEKPVVSDPCQDITQFLAETTTLWKQNYTLSEGEKKSFFKTYKSSLGGIDKNIEERVEIYRPYLYLRALSWCAHAWLDYQSPDKAIVNKDTFIKIESYLEEDFMKSLLSRWLI